MADKQVSWNLDDIVTLSHYDTLFVDVSSRIDKLASLIEALSSDMTEDEFRNYLDFSISLADDMARLSYRPMLMESIDATDEQALLLKGKVTDLGLAVAEVSRKFDQWMKGLEVEGKPGLDDANAKRLFAAHPKLTYSLEYARSGRAHTLPVEQESIIAAKDANGISQLSDMRDLIVTDQRYTLSLPGKKPKQYQTDDELKVLVFDTDPLVREAAYKALFDSYERNVTKYFTIYQAVVKDWGYEAKLRGFSSPIAMRNYANHIPDRAIEVLMEVCERNTGVFAEYFRYKAGKLGMDKLRRFDIYAPLAQSNKTIDYSDALDVVLTTFNEFSPQFAKHAKRIVDERHIDTKPHPKKRGGAFCATVNAHISPYVLLNYTGTDRDVSTLAHELGHGVHALYAADLPSTVQHATLPLAETASTLAEMILFEKLLDLEKDPAEREAMLAAKIADSYATIIRQSYFVKAELEAHKRMAEGLTATDMGQVWLKTLTDQFGDSVEVDPIFALEWAYIPHIVHSPFYCYSYNFGELLSLALFAKYKEQGKAFVPKIETILAAGGSQDPVKVLKAVEIDMTDPNFWQGSFTILEGWMKQLKTIE